MSIESGTASPAAIAYAFGSWGATSMRPSTMPMTGVPPKRFIVDQQTSAGRNANAVSVRIWLMRSRLSLISTPRLCAAPRSPMKRPVATSTGIIGTNTSPSVRETFCSGVI